MTVDVDALDLDFAQDAIRGAMNERDDDHNLWKFFEAMWRYGDDSVAREAVESGTLAFDEEARYRDVANMLLPHLTVMEGSITAQDPAMVATPVEGGPRAEENAGTAEGVLEYFWTRQDVTPKIQEAVHDMMITGNGFVKVGWAYEDEEEDLDEDEQFEDYVDVLEADRAMAELEGREPADEEELMDRVHTTRTRVIEDEPWVEYVSPYDIFVDEAATSIQNARWIAQRVRMPMDEIRGNEKYDKKAREAVSADHDYDTDVGVIHHDAEERNVGKFEMATVWEFYDMRARRLKVIHLSVDEPLYDEELPYSHRHPPFIHFRNYKQSGTDFWGFGDIESVASLQRQFNDFLTEALDNVRRPTNKYFIDEQYWSDDVEAVLQSPIEDEVGRINFGGEPIESLIHTFKREPVDDDVYQARADVEQYMRDVLGINDFQAGGVGADRMSATAAALVDGVATTRATVKAATVERGVARVGQILLLICQEFIEEPRAIRVSGKTGEDAEWPEVGPEELFGEFRVTVEGGSMRAENPSTREERGRRLLTEVLPTAVEFEYDPAPIIRAGVRDLGFDPAVVLQKMPQQPMGPEGPPGGGGGQGQQSAQPEGAPPAAVEGGPPEPVAAQLAGEAAI